MYIMTDRGWKRLQPTCFIPAPHDKTLCEQLGISSVPMDLNAYDDLCRRRELPADDPRSIGDLEFWRQFKAL